MMENGWYSAEADVFAEHSLTSMPRLQLPQLIGDLREVGVDLVERDLAVEHDHRLQNERPQSQG
jgi:hypothetical protein